MTEELGELARVLGASEVRIRREALRSLVVKKASQVVLRKADPGIFALLRQALRDPDEAVRWGAAYALRPLVGKDPELFSAILPEYAIRSFDGSYSHVGLLDTRTGVVWVPSWQTVKGHAALLGDGDTDRYFKFQFYLAKQAPPRMKRDAPSTDAHLVVNYIIDWSYSRQHLLIPGVDRGRDECTREQEGYEELIRAFYRSSRLPYGVTIHRTCWESNRPPGHRYGVGRIESFR